MFITGTGDSPIGLYGIKFFIRGKPWIVDVDDKLLFENGDLKYMNMADNGSIWAAILEKAWAKVKGNYAQTNGGFVVSGLRAVTGAPVFTYVPSSSSYDLTDANTFLLLEAADDAGYMLGAGTASGLNTQTNDCGLAYGHAYAIMAVFEMDSTEMLLMRNPWGYTSYSGPWAYDDSSWTDDLVA